MFFTYIFLYHMRHPIDSSFFFFNDTATTEIYTLSLHDALPISAFTEDFMGGTTTINFQTSQRIMLPIDRKSTRLNSSHDQISYAVFCLKKKKTNMYIRTNSKYCTDR